MSFDMGSLGTQVSARVYHAVSSIHRINSYESLQAYGPLPAPTGSQLYYSVRPLPLGRGAACCALGGVEWSLVARPRFLPHVPCTGLATPWPPVQSPISPPPCHPPLALDRTSVLNYPHNRVRKNKRPWPRPAGLGFVPPSRAGKGLGAR